MHLTGQKAERSELLVEVSKGELLLGKSLMQVFSQNLLLLIFRSLFTFCHSHVIQSLHSHILTILVVARHCRDVTRSKQSKINFTRLCSYRAESSPSFLQEPLSDENEDEENSAEYSSDQSCDCVFLSKNNIRNSTGKHRTNLVLFVVGNFLVHVGLC